MRPSFISTGISRAIRASRPIWKIRGQRAREYGYVETVFGTASVAARNQRRQRTAAPGGRTGGDQCADCRGLPPTSSSSSMIAVQGWLETAQWRSKMIMQVHDELVLEVPDEEFDEVRVRLPELMCGVAQLKVPLVAEVGAGAKLGRGALRGRRPSAARRFRAQTKPSGSRREPLSYCAALGLHGPSRPAARGSRTIRSTSRRRVPRHAGRRLPSPADCGRPSRPSRTA